MKKLLIMCLIVLGPIAARASGKLSYQVNAYDQGQSYGQMLGINAYQKLNKWSAINTWAGVGSQPREVSEDVNWAMVKSQMDFYVGRWTIAPGLQYKFVAPYSDHDLSGFVKAELRLW